MAAEKKRVVLTGGAGFIGSHLTDLLLARGYKVHCIDNLITGNKNNIAHLAGNQDYTFVQADVIDPAGCKVDGPVDYVLHFASPASPIDYHQLPFETLKVGSYATHNLLELAREKRAVFFLASTSEVYGDPVKEFHPQPEEYFGNVNSVGPRSVYDEAKRYAEAVTMAYNRTHKVDVRIVRIFNTFGPKMRINDGRAVPTFISQAFNGENLTVFGDGSQTRSFCYVSDLIEGIYRLMTSSETKPVNIGNPAEMTILELAKFIIAKTGSKSGIEYKPLPENDPLQRRPNIDKAKRLLGYEPKVSLEDGIEKTIGYFRETAQGGKSA